MNVDITCQELVELVTGYLEGALPARERERFEHHLALCPGCVIYVEQMRETVRLTGERPREETLPPESPRVAACRVSRLEAALVLATRVASPVIHRSHARRVARRPPANERDRPKSPAPVHGRHQCSCTTSLCASGFVTGNEGQPAVDGRAGVDR